MVKNGIESSQASQAVIDDGARNPFEHRRERCYSYSRDLHRIDVQR